MLPILALSGSSLEQGRTHGRALRGEIRHNLTLYFRRFAREAGLPPAEVLRRAALYLGALETLHPVYLAGMRGVAEGAGVDLVEVAALNVRYEILYDAFGKTDGRRGGIDGCTSFALTPEWSANGHLLLGQNWDWVPGVKGALIHVQENDLGVLAFTEAGIVGGKIGLNSAGLGLAINGMTSEADDWARLGLPFHARCHDILRQHTLAAAERSAAQEPRGCSANFMLAQAPGKVLDLETAPHTLCRLEPEQGVMVHANHFTDPRLEADPEERPGSLLRHARLGALLAGGGPFTLAEVQERLRDRANAPDAVCRYPDPARDESERYATVVSVVMDLHDRVMYVSDGPPDVNPYEVVRLQAVERENVALGVAERKERLPVQ